MAATTKDHNVRQTLVGMAKDYEDRAYPVLEKKLVRHKPVEKPE